MRLVNSQPKLPSSLPVPQGAKPGVFASVHAALRWIAGTLLLTIVCIVCAVGAWFVARSAWWAVTDLIPRLFR